MTAHKLHDESGALHGKLEGGRAATGVTGRTRLIQHTQGTRVASGGSSDA